MLWLRTRLRIFYAEDDGTGGGSGGGGESGEGDKGMKFSGVLIEKQDPITKKIFQIPKELEPILGHFINYTRGETEKKYKPMLEALESEKNDLTGIKAEYEKLKEASMTAEDRAMANAKKAIAEYERKALTSEEKSKKFERLFSDAIVDNDILTSFGATKLCNADQVKILFREEGGAHYEEKVDGEGKPTGKYGTRMTLALENDKGEPELVEGTPAELFSRWIKLERNAHHVLLDMGTGGGSRQGTSTKGGKVDFLKLPPKERIDAARQANSGK